MQRKAAYDAFKRYRFHSARKLLSLWLRPRILGAGNGQLGLAPDQPVCYVLPRRSLADLLVVDQACEDEGLPRPFNPMAAPFDDEWRSFFFLAHAEGRPFQRLSHRTHSARSTRLAARLAEHDDLEVRVVPVSVFWGHEPDRDKSLIKLLLSENWTATGRVKKMLALVFHPYHLVIQFSHPVSLRRLVDSEASQVIRLRKLSRILRVHFRRRRQAILGPDLSHRRTMLDSLMTSTSVRSAIARETEVTGVPLPRIEAKAAKIASGLAAHQTYRVIRFFDVLLRWLWDKLYDGVEVHNIEAVQELAEVHELVYVPCHRSHIDYLLLSYVLYHNGLTPPHIAAGENLNLPLVGPLLRRAGAFFMRRSFQDDDLYKTIFDEYLHRIFIGGYSVEYFIEGGRSRTGRTNQPRIGMLNMTVRSFSRDPSSQIVFVPVYFGYEKLIEEATYLSELRGAEKKTESLRDILVFMRSLTTKYGKVSVNFGAPITLEGFLDQRMPTWRDADGGSRVFFDVCLQLARRIAININAAAALNPVGLLALVMLAAPRLTMTERSLLADLAFLQRLHAAGLAGSGTTMTAQTPAEVIARAERLLTMERLSHPLGDLLRIGPVQAILLTYYRNNVAHVFALPSLVTAFLLHRESITLGELRAGTSLLFRFLRAEFFLELGEPEAVANCERTVSFFADERLVMRSEGDELIAAKGSLVLESFAAVVEPTLQRYYIVVSLLRRGIVSPDELQVTQRQIAQQISILLGIDAPEFSDDALFTVFFETMQREQFIDVRNGSVELLARLDELHAAIEQLADLRFKRAVEDAIHQLPDVT